MLKNCGFEYDNVTHFEGVLSRRRTIRHSGKGGGVFGGGAGWLVLFWSPRFAEGSLKGVCADPGLSRDVCGCWWREGVRRRGRLARPQLPLLLDGVLPRCPAPIRPCYYRLTVLAFRVMKASKLQISSRKVRPATIFYL